MKITCIIPVYKVESYLRLCVESLTHQTYQNIEIILVDDGSPDGSPELCEVLAGEDSRIRVIHKDNGGLSEARNVGLLAASGDYVVFVDGDDYWLSQDAMRQLVNEIRPELDFIGFNCSYYYPILDKYRPWVPYDVLLSSPVDKNTAMTELVKSGTFPMSACLKLLKRSFLVDNNLFFKKGQIAEDIPWFINILEKTSRCCFVNMYIYAYRQNVVGSITHTNDRRSFDSLFDIFKTELLKIEKRSFNEEAKNALKSFLAYEYCILLTYLRDFDRGEQNTFREKLYSYKSILNFTDNPKVRKASVVYRFLGIRATEFVLGLYQNYRRKRM